MLLNCLKPKKDYNLVRLGRKGDGGYLATSDSIKQADLLISMGISSDWSFEKDFLRFNKVPIQAYDHTVTLRFWRKLIIRHLFKGVFCLKIKELFRCIAVSIDYNFFFHGDVKHIKKMIGLTSQNAITVDQILQQSDANKNIFFKIDIEGSEYRILDDLVKHASRITGLVIEFHDVDLHIDKIEKFVNQLPLTLVHIHANNFCDLDEQGNPMTLELSFANQPADSNKPWQHPHTLDSPNNLRKNEMLLNFNAL
jgi:hypothetical protein